MVAIVVRAACLLGVGTGLGFVVNAARTDGVALSSFTAPSACPAAPSPAVASAGVSGTAPAVEVLAPVAAADLCHDPRAVVVDVRSPAAFAEGHVAGALHLPCAAPGGAAQAAVELLAGRSTLIVYGRDTDEALPVAEELRRRAGRSNLRIVVIEGGFSRWSAANLACSSGPCPECGVPHE
jgi:rhodanese-related sulfurtransferase